MSRLARRHTNPAFTRLRVERLEPREVPAVFTVTSPLDDGSAGTLRWAVGQANAAAGDDSVVFDPALTASGPVTVTLTAGTLTLTDTSGATAIDGGGAVTVAGGGQSGVFRVEAGATATLTRLTITGGASQQGGGVFNAGTLTITQSTIVNNTAVNAGGGVFNAGTLTVTESAVAGNTASSGGTTRGGGVYNGGTATIERSTVINNAAIYNVAEANANTADGGGVYNSGTLTLDHDDISANTAGKGITRGGGVFDDTTGTVTLTRCTVANNGGTAGVYTSQGTLTFTDCTIASNSFGGVISLGGTLTLTQCRILNNTGSSGVLNDRGGTATLTRCTVVNNSFSGSGGGVDNISGTLVATQCTIANNTCDSGGGLRNDSRMTLTQCTIANNITFGNAIGGGVDNRGLLTITQSTIVNNTAVNAGGGVFNEGQLTLANSLVVGNSTGDLFNNNRAGYVQGVFIDNGGNLIGVPAGFTLGQVVQVDGSRSPLLADNGGPTPTIALAHHSPAQDAGLDANASGLATDQRGLPRVVSAHVDVGAVETQTQPQAAPPPLPLAVALGGTVTVTDATTGAVITTLHPFPGFGGSVVAVVADFTGDGVADYAVGAGAGGGPHVKVYDGVSGQEIASFYAFAPTFAGGVSLAAGDVIGDGVADLIVGAGPGGGPHVKVFSGPLFAQVRSFFAYDSAFTGGVSVAAGDLDGDGFAEVITGAGPGGGPHVKAFDGRTGAVVRSFYAYDPSFTGGVSVAVGDLDGDGRAEIITGAGAGGGPHVKAFAADDAVAASFFAYDAAFAGGVRVGVRDVNRDGFADIVTAAGPGGSPHVKAFDGRTGGELQSFFAGAADDPRGVFVG